MNTNVLKNSIRLAGLAALTLLPAMACSYSASSAAAGAGGGNLAVQVFTQPGCPWSAEAPSFASIYSGRQGYGSGSVFINVHPNNGRARSAPVRIYTTGQSNQFGGRSGPTVQIVFQSTLTQYGR